MFFREIPCFFAKEERPKPGLELIRLILSKPSESAARARALLQSAGDQRGWILDWAETILVYKLPQLSRVGSRSAATSLEELSEPDLPEQLKRWQPQIRYVLLEEHRFDHAELAGLRNVAAALSRLENNRAAEDIERVLECEKLEDVFDVSI